MDKTLQYKYLEGLYNSTTSEELLRLVARMVEFPNDVIIEHFSLETPNSFLFICCQHYIVFATIVSNNLTFYARIRKTRDTTKSFCQYINS